VQGGGLEAVKEKDSDTKFTKTRAGRPPGGFGAGLRAGGRRGGRRGEGGRREVEVVGEPRGQIQIDHSDRPCPAHGDLSPRARIYSLCSWSIL
jgi:hypothetical protein